MFLAFTVSRKNISVYVVCRECVKIGLKLCLIPRLNYFPSLALDTWLLYPSNACTHEHTHSSTLKPCSVGCKCSVSRSEKYHCSSSIFTESSIVERHPYQMLCALGSEASLQGGKPVRGNKHLSCANWSVKCTNCRGEGDVSAGVTALGLGAMSGPGISWVAPPPPSSPFTGPTHAKGHNGNYYLLAVCLISSYSYWLVAPPQPTPLVSSLRGGSGKIISGKHLDHLFKAPGNSRKPNCPHLCVGLLSFQDEQSEGASSWVSEGLFTD